jgi:hypothetical protein
VFPLFYSDISGYQYIDWHITRTVKDHWCIEHGAYDKKTGDLVLGAQIGYTEKKDKDAKEGDKPKKVCFGYAGEFKNGMLNGIGRIYTSKQNIFSGTYKDNEQEEGTLFTEIDCDGDLGYYGEFKGKAQDSLVVYNNKMQEPNSKVNNWMIQTRRSGLQSGLAWTYNRHDQGKPKDFLMFENDKDLQQEVTKEQCDKFLAKWLEDNKEFKRMWESDKDVRQLIGLRNDPLDYI